MHAVAWTDLIQGSIMIVGFAVLAPVAVGAAGGFAEMHLRYAEFNPGGISFLGDMPAVWVVSSFLVWGFFQIGGAPAAVTRFLIPKDRGTLRRALVFSIAFSSFIYIGSTLIAIASGVLLPELAQTDLALPTLVQLLMHPVFGGILVAAVLGATMSTIDSVLLLASSLVVENLYVPLARREVSQERGLRLARWTTLAIGVLAMIVAIDPPATILFIVTMSFSLMASAFTFPLLLGMWWPRATRAGGDGGDGRRGAHMRRLVLAWVSGTRLLRQLDRRALAGAGGAGGVSGVPGGGELDDAAAAPRSARGVLRGKHGQGAPVKVGGVPYRAIFTERPAATEVRVIDQTLLPHRFETMRLETVSRRRARDP